MKKIISLAMVALLLICVVSGCSSKNIESESYYERGLDLIFLSKELIANDEYVKSYNLSEDHKSLISNLTSLDTSKLTAIFSLDLSKEALKLFSVNMSKCSENVKAYLSNNAMTSIPSVINARAGSSFALVSSVATVSTTFDHKGAESPLMYLYIFENGYAYAVNFKPGYDNSVFAVASPIFDESLSICKNADDIVKYLKAYGIAAEQSDILLIEHP